MGEYESLVTFSLLGFHGFPLIRTTEQEKILRDTLVSPLGSKYSSLCLCCLAATQFTPSNWHTYLNQNNDSFLCLLIQIHEEPGSRPSFHQRHYPLFWTMATSEDQSHFPCCKICSLVGGHVGWNIMIRQKYKSTNGNAGQGCPGRKGKTVPEI